MYGGFPPTTPSDWSFATAAAAASIASHHPRSPAHRFHPADTSCALTSNSGVHNSGFLAGATEFAAGDNSPGACSFNPHRPVNYPSAAFFADNAAYSAAFSTKPGALNSNIGNGFNVFPGTAGTNGSKLLDSLNTTPPSGSAFSTSGSAFGLHGAGLLSHTGNSKLYADITDRHQDPDSGRNPYPHRIIILNRI